jgi:hypothetical protein
MCDDIDKWYRCLVKFVLGIKMVFHAVKSIANKVWMSLNLEDGIYVSD